jgi:hypothetical protein
MMVETRRITDYPMRPAGRHPRTLMCVLWQVIRLPVLMLLVILEPIVTFVLAGLALAGVLATIFYKTIGLPHFPMWIMLMLSLGFIFVLLIYETLIRVFSN